MAHTDLHLLRAILDSGDLQTPARMGVNRSTFQTDHGRVAYDLLHDHYNDPENLGHVLSSHAFSQICPAVWRMLPAPSMSVLEACKCSILAAQRQELVETLTKATLHQEDVTKATGILRSGIDTILSIGSRGREHDFGTTALDHIAREYPIIKMKGGMLGYPWPSDWDILNERTAGIEKGMYMVIHGRPGTMKSYLMCKLAVHFLKNTKLRVYFFNNEMSSERLITRMSLLYAGISSTSYRNGTLSSEEEIRLLRSLALLKQLTQDGKTDGRIAISSAGWSRTVTEMGAKLNEHKSHICLLDGGYLLVDDKGRTAERPDIATSISRKVQRQCLNTGIPHIVTTQTGRKAEEQTIHQRISTVSNIGYTDAWGQDASFVIALLKGKTELTMMFPKVREDENMDPITININPGVDFSYKGDYISPELYEEEKKKNGSPRKKTGIFDELNISGLSGSITSGRNGPS